MILCSLIKYLHEIYTEEITREGHEQVQRAQAGTRVSACKNNVLMFPPALNTRALAGKRGHSLPDIIYIIHQPPPSFPPLI